MAIKDAKTAQENQAEAEREKKRQERKARRDNRSASNNERNPLVEKARARYLEELREQEVATEQIRTRVRSYVKDVIKPALKEAKAVATSKNLRGPARQKYIEETLQAQLGKQGAGD